MIDYLSSKICNSLMPVVHLKPGDLKIGHYIHLPPSSKVHPFFFSSFRIKKHKQLQIIHQLSLDLVLVDFRLSKIKPNNLNVNVINPVTCIATESNAIEDEAATGAADELKFDIQSAYKEDLKSQLDWWNIIQDANRGFENNVVLLQDVYCKITVESKKAIQYLNELTNVILDHSKLDGNFNFVLCTAELSIDVIFQNAINVAVLSCKLAIQLGLNSKECFLITQIALLSNYGLFWVPQTIRNKRVKLNQSENNFLKMHPAYAKKKLQVVNSFTPKFVHSISQVHEKLDGSGYPYGTKGSKITSHARIVGLATYYNSLCNSSTSAQRLSPHLVILKLVKEAGTHYSKKHIGQLIHILGIYPTGTILKYHEHIGQSYMTLPDRIKNPFLVSFTDIQSNFKSRIIDTGLIDSVHINPINTEDVDKEYVTKFRLRNRYNIYCTTG
ncbi:HD-GYP domain-containing protein [Moritella sp. F3]|uniref:HD-GYP domain-containing protein n=1 Tax=Moritella sp. F3 TaxID=2718882 RepID=UPI0018E14846|nr:HD-GYP domain-containing protein [Moritella sp. F3]GIC77688.1 phosphodiesterase [Moritella sp. F1]GIC82101.1 phosphodiesterase [Moritella sp. F3]